jgi:hypothetical protein
LVSLFRARLNNFQEKVQYLSVDFIASVKPGKAAAFLRAYCALGEPDAWAAKKRQDFSAMGVA